MITIFERQFRHWPKVNAELLGQTKTTGADSPIEKYIIYSTLGSMTDQQILECTSLLDDGSFLISIPFYKWELPLFPVTDQLAEYTAGVWDIELTGSFSKAEHISLYLAKYYNNGTE